MTSLFFVGDIMIGRTFNELKNVDNVISKPIQGLLAEGLTFGNLETVVSNSEEIFDPKKTFHFRAKIDNAKTILQPFHILSISNNHIFDYGEKGLTDTKKVLDEMKILHSNSYFQYSDMKFGFLSCSDHPKEWKNHIWIIDFKNKESVDDALFLIKETKKHCDFLIMYIHWGANYVDKIPKEHISFAHQAIENGLDILAGTSAHHTLPIEQYKGGLIFYGLGDFVDDYAIDERYRNDLGMIVKVNIEKDKMVSYRKYNTKISNLKVEFA